MDSTSDKLHAVSRWYKIHMFQLFSVQLFFKQNKYLSLVKRTCWTIMHSRGGYPSLRQVKYSALGRCFTCLSLLSFSVGTTPIACVSDFHSWTWLRTNKEPQEPRKTWCSSNVLVIDWLPLPIYICMYIIDLTGWWLYMYHFPKKLKMTM